MCPGCDTVCARGANGYCKACNATTVKAWRHRNPTSQAQIAQRAKRFRKIRDRIGIAKRWADKVRDHEGRCVNCSRHEHTDACEVRQFIHGLDLLLTLWEG